MTLVHCKLWLLMTSQHGSGWLVACWEDYFPDGAPVSGLWKYSRNAASTACCVSCKVGAVITPGIYEQVGGFQCKRRVKGKNIPCRGMYIFGEAFRR